MSELLSRLVDQIVSLRRRVGALESVEMALRTGQGCRVYNNADQTIPQATWTALSFNTVYYDYDDCWSSSYPTRLTCQTSGLYIITGHVRWAANSNGERIMGIYKSDGVGYATCGQLPVPSQTRMSIATILPLQAGEYVILQVYQTSGGDLAVISALSQSPIFAMARIG